MSGKDDQLYESVTTDDNNINNPFNALELDTLISNACILSVNRFALKLN